MYLFVYVKTVLGFYVFERSLDFLMLTQLLDQNIIIKQFILSILLHTVSLFSILYYHNVLRNEVNPRSILATPSLTGSNELERGSGANFTKAKAAHYCWLCIRAEQQNEKQTLGQKFLRPP